MPVKRYGIFLAYPPTVDLNHEGLGRYLASFLRGAAGCDGVQFVVLCPSWSLESLKKLFKAEGVPDSAVELVYPAGKPLFLRFYEAHLHRKKRVRGPALWRRWLAWLAGLKNGWVSRVEKKLVGAYSTATLLPILLELIGLGLLVLALSPLLVLVAILYPIGILLKRMLRLLAGFSLGVALRANELLRSPQDDALVLRLYKYMEEAETERMLSLQKNMPGIRAWYCPTAFWPAFNKIPMPRLTCVPDVVLTKFPVSFSDVGGDRTLRGFGEIQTMIRGGEHFVTYSEETKWQTLVEQFSVDPRKVTTIHHAPNDLSSWISVKGFPDNNKVGRYYCERLLKAALERSGVPEYSSGFANTSFKFLFYASQFRPNKNQITLLRAYEYLLKKKRIGHKLLLTGNVVAYPLVDAFIKKQGLRNDVLCLHGLAIEELAACYRLADLAVNPSLSEGGCPFTFTEALSVDTPVVLGRIPVTEEVLSDPDFQRVTFFDPYDWRDLARRIEWATEHRTELLEIQKKTYSAMAQRTWTDVVREHVAILDRISEDHSKFSSEVTT
jgi:glycosyltransferase involved in cell wall biosynthesis